MGLRFSIFGTDFGERAHDTVGVLVDAVIDGAFGIGVSPFVIHSQAPSDVGMADRGAQFAKLHKVAARFPERRFDIVDVGDL